MHTDELMRLGTEYIPNFVGVYPLDRFPTWLKCPANLIVNTHTHNLPGEHWLAISYRRGGIIYAFDPLGFHYPLSLRRCLHSLKSHRCIHYNTTKWQDATETTCGWYCLAWLMAQQQQVSINMWCLLLLFTCTMPPYVLDILMTTGEQLKELCILDVDAPHNPLYYIFRQPTPHTTTTTTDEDLQWWEGNSRCCHNCVMFHIKEAYPDTWSSSVFYVAEEKVTLARELFPELPIWGAKSPSSSSSFSSNICLFREHGHNCAYILCMRLYDSLCCD